MLYRVGLQTILGFTKTGDTLRVTPAVPRGWPQYTIEYRYGESTYVITVRQGGARRVGASVVVDGVERSDGTIQLADDGRQHQVIVELSP